MKKLLFISSYKGMWPFVQNLSNELVKNGYDVHILREHKLLNFSGKTKRVLIPVLPKLIDVVPMTIRVYLRKIINKRYKKIFNRLKGKYDVTLILYHHDKFNKYSDIIKQTSNKLVICYAGSDFYNINNKIKEENKCLINIADTICFNTPYMANDFRAYYKDYNSKIEIVGFGLNNLDIIKKIKKTEKLNDSKKIVGIPLDKTIISIGYTGDKRHRHLDFLEKLKTVPKSITEHLFFIFPMTYIKTEEYIKAVKQKAEKLNISYKIFETLLSDDDICRIRIVTDIAIHIATMDQSSASMMEHIYAGNVVIAGEWLPYNFWDDMGVYSHRVKEDDIIHSLINVLKELEEEKKNSQKNSKIIYDNWVWEKRINRWVEVL